LYRNKYGQILILVFFWQKFFYLKLKNVVKEATKKSSSRNQSCPNALPTSKQRKYSNESQIQVQEKTEKN